MTAPRPRGRPPGRNATVAWYCRVTKEFAARLRDAQRDGESKPKLLERLMCALDAQSDCK